MMFSAVHKELATLEPLLTGYLHTSNEAINQIIDHIFASGGKRIRPALFFFMSKIFSYEGQHFFPMAATCEYIHTASLLHDDVIDNSSLRRNKPTTNAIWGDETAVLVGDLIYAQACRFMAQVGHLPLIDNFAECIRLMSESELLQLNLLWKHDISIQDCETIIHGKTVRLFQMCARVPGMLQGENAQVLTYIDDFAHHLGMAYQISDDILDYTALEKDLGKPSLCDLSEGKITIPLILSLKNSSSSTLKDLVIKVIDSGTISLEEKSLLLSEVHASQGLEEAHGLVKNHVEEAKKSLFYLRITLSQQNQSQYDNIYDALSALVDFVGYRKN